MKKILQLVGSTRAQSPLATRLRSFVRYRQLRETDERLAVRNLVLCAPGILQQKNGLRGG